jgi:aminopeptidase N
MVFYVIAALTVLLSATTTDAAGGAAEGASQPTPTGPASDSLTVLARHLDLELAVHYDDGTLSGTASLTVENAGASGVTVIPLQIGRLMTARSVRDGEGRALDFSQDVIAYEDWSTRQVNQLHVRLPERLEPGERLTVAIRYSGPLVGATETGMLYVRDHVDRDFTILRSEAFAFPQLAVPSLALNRRAPRSDFTYRARFTVPSDLTVATGVPPEDRTEADGVSTWTFEAPGPVPFLNVAVAPFRTVAKGGLRVFHFPEDSTGAERLLERMLQTIDLYASWFGPLDREPRLHVIEIPEGWGSQASLTGGIIQTADAFRDRRQLRQLYHELAHLWHPHDLERPAPRWNEGLATFLAGRTAAELGDGEELSERMPAAAERQLSRVGQSAELASTPMVEYGKASATGLSYGTGELMFYVLHEVLGPEEFNRTLGGWFEQYRGDGSTTRQFVDFAQTRTDTDLEALFRDWLFTVRWRERLESGESLADMIETYKPKE